MNDAIRSAAKAKDVLEKVLLEEVGPRCPDHDPDCIVCCAWSAFDTIDKTVNSYIETQIMEAIDDQR